MTVEDDVRSLDARVAHLKSAVEGMTRAQLESVEWCAQACRSHGKRLGLTLRPAWRPWTEAEHEYLRENWESGTPTEEICAHLGRGEKAVRQRAHELGLTQSGRRNRIALDRSSRRFWSKGAS